MNAWFHVRTATLWLFGAVLVLLGALLVLQLAALLAWQYSIALDTRAWPRMPLMLMFADPAKASGAAAQFLSVLPEIPWPWLRDPQNVNAAPHMAATWLLGELHLGLLPALLGLVAAWTGISLIGRQKRRYAVAQREKEDRVRRLRAYRREQRIEPSLAERRAEPALSEPRREPRLSA
jgi:hypothetical protein